MPRGLVTTFVGSLPLPVGKATVVVVLVASQAGCGTAEVDPEAHSSGDVSSSSAPAESGSSEAADAEPEPGFFVTRDGNPNGGDFGGLVGADARCSELAAAAGLPDRTWRAFLSASGPTHARDRIGPGPWWSVAGDLVATDIDALMRDGVPDEAMLDEFGNTASKSAPPGTEHDILTGSNPDGQLQSNESTCADWTSSLREDRSTVGHHDWERLPNGQWTQSWSTVHSAPCDLEGMRVQLGAARIYCFGAD